MPMKNKKNHLRKFSDHHIYSDEGPGKYNRFCLRSVDSNSLSELAGMTFMSPIKMRAAFGPDNQYAHSYKQLDLSSSIFSSQDMNTPKTCPTSPLPSVFTVQQNDNPSTKLKMSADMTKLMGKLGLTNEKLMSLSEEKLEELKEISIFEAKQLSLWR
jgi:hypothetical protein